MQQGGALQRDGFARDEAARCGRCALEPGVQGDGLLEDEGPFPRAEGAPACAGQGESATIDGRLRPPEPAMLDHVTIGVGNVERSKAFYDEALRPLGIERLAGDETFAGYGIRPRAFFWIGHRDARQTGMHVAFAARDRATVDRFHAAALRAGGVDNGPPGLRPHYHPDYYGAFVLDPDGHNIEAVYRSGPD